MSLIKRAVKGAIFVAASTYLIDIIGFIRSIILARLLIPEYFGIVALATFFYGFFRQFKEFNFNTALIHRQDTAQETYSTHFLLMISLAVINFLVVLLISPFLAKFYGQEIVKIVIIFTFFSIFQEASATPRIFLEKELLFGRVSLIDITREIVKTIVPIYMAIRGFGIWSLVAMAILDMTIPLLGFLMTKTWKLSFRLNKEIAVWFFKYSSYMWLGGLCTMLIFEFDDFLVGSMVGTLALGLYSKAYEFSKLPVRMVTHIINRVSLPLYSKLKENRTELSRAFNNFLYLIIRITLPFSILLYIIAPEFIYLFLGDKWVGVIPLLRLLVIYSVLRSIEDDCGALLFGLGKPRIVTQITLIQSALMLSMGAVFVYFWQAKGASIFVDFMSAVGVIIIYKRLSNFIEVEYRKNFIAPLLSSAVATLLTWLCLRNFVIPNLICRLILKIVLFSLAYVFVLVSLTKNELKNKFRYILGIIKEKY